MAAVAAEIPEEFSSGPMEGSLLRFIKEHRSCVVWEGKVKLKPTPAEYSLLIIYIMLILFFSISKILSLIMVLLALNA